MHVCVGVGVSNAVPCHKNTKNEFQLSGTQYSTGFIVRSLLSPNHYQLLRATWPAGKLYHRLIVIVDRLHIHGCHGQRQRSEPPIQLSFLRRALQGPEGYAMLSHFLQGVCAWTEGQRRGGTQVPRGPLQHQVHARK